jgi:hypothetical protein
MTNDAMDIMDSTAQCSMELDWIPPKTENKSKKYQKPKTKTYVICDMLPRFSIEIEDSILDLDGRLEQIKPRHSAGARASHQPGTRGVWRGCETEKLQPQHQTKCWASGQHC